MEACLKAIRYHDISCGHRIYGHEGKCSNLHGHNYRIHFHCEAKNLDEIGRVIDFGVIKLCLCGWIEDNWDHKLLLWGNDPLAMPLAELSPESVSLTSFNPTAENMAKFLCEELGPLQLCGTNVRLTAVVVEETRKCSASYSV
jgi:6-pyruvoyltetrahydropterin/6-carboxytetrahydropterin synthase